MKRLQWTLLRIRLKFNVFYLPYINTAHGAHWRFYSNDSVVYKCPLNNNNIIIIISIGLRRFLLLSFLKFVSGFYLHIVCNLT